MHAPARSKAGSRSSAHLYRSPHRLPALLPSPVPAPPRAAAPASQVVHLLLSHKRSMRGMPLVEGMVQALGADMPLGNADVAGERLSAWWQGRVRYQVGI